MWEGERARRMSKLGHEQWEGKEIVCHSGLNLSTQKIFLPLGGYQLLPFHPRQVQAGV